MINPTIFRDYDIRAKFPEELDRDGLVRLTKAFYHIFKPRSVAIGYDSRTSGPEWNEIITNVFLSAGIDVTQLGMISTDMMTFASGKYGYDLSIEITASHNPSEYNGFKMATKGGNSVNGENGYYKARDLAIASDPLKMPAGKGKLFQKDIYSDWTEFCFSFVDSAKFKPLTVVIDAGNGVAGKIFDQPVISERTGLKIKPLFFEPDGRFPNHIPNPLKPENHAWIKKEIISQKADLGIMLDGDGDRITFFDEKGTFISGSIITALVAKMMLKKEPGSTVVYNAVCGRIAPETILKAGGKPERVRVGYSLIKQRMIETNAIFAGEHSCHFLYRDVWYSEASLLTALLVIQAFNSQVKPFSEFMAEYDIYVQSGEINFEVEDKEGVMKKIAQAYESEAESVDWLDGVSVWYKNYWINVRPSNTQPLLRLNVEADTQEILDEKLPEAIARLKSFGAVPSSD